MRNSRGCATWVATLASIIVWGLAGFWGASARPVESPAPGITAIDLDTSIDANNIRMCVSNLGMFGCHTDGPGWSIPRAAAGTVCMLPGFGSPPGSTVRLEPPWAPTSPSISRGASILMEAMTRTASHDIGFTS